MAHDKNLVLVYENFAKRLSFYSGLYTRILFGRLALAAVVLNVARRFDNRLVTATAECKVDCGSCKFIVLTVGKSVESDADTKSNRSFVTDTYGLDFFKNIELGFL